MLKTERFNYAPEKKQNPYIGFMSFQHFRGEKLYSDIVVRSENRYCETERVECYPVSADAEENGRAEGYYPDTSIAYIRILWKEFEPEQGKFNYAFIENIINEAKKHGQSLVFRLMAHSTRAEDDVPEWLKGIMPCPERPAWERVKDSPTDPRYIDLFLNAIKVFGERFDSEPTLDMVDISLPGAWGEGHNLHLYPENTYDRIADTYASVFKKTRLFTQVSRPELIERINKTAERKVGWRGDGFGSPNHIKNIYPPLIERVKDNWKTAPVAFESYWWIGEWKRQGWDIDELIEKSLEWHISSFNAKSLPIPYEWKDKVDNWISKMGYHFVIDSVTSPVSAVAGETVEIKTVIDNVGVAPIYEEIPLRVRLKNAENEYVFGTDTDIRKWLPGKSEESLNITLPIDVKKGEYELYLGISGICFASDAENDGDFYRVGKMDIR